MASSNSESSIEVVVDDDDAETHAAPSSPLPRRRSARNAARNLRRIILNDTTLFEDHHRQEVESNEVGDSADIIGRRISSSSEEDVNVKKRKKRKCSGANDEDQKIGGEEDTEESSCCSICFEDFTNAGSHRLVCLKCGHIFGQSCIEKWIRSEKNAKCPQCKERARISDIRRIFARNIKMVDTTELELLRNSLKVYKAENEDLRIEVAELKTKLQNAVDAAKAVKKHQDDSHSPQFELFPSSPVSLKSGPSLVISNDYGSRYIDASRNLFVVTCSMLNGLFLPFGLKLITKEGRVKIAVPVHSRKPRCCVFSPFNESFVLSTGEDKTLCITSFADNSATVLHRFELPANGWSCCWISETEVAAGLINGRVLKFGISDGTSIPTDLTDGDSRFPIIAVHWVNRASSLIVVSIRECCFYRHQTKSSVAKGSIMSFCWNARNECFMLSFSPSGTKHFTEHALYRVNIEGGSMNVLEIDRFQSQSNKQTRMIHCNLWDVGASLFSAIFDEAHSQLVVFDWNKARRVVRKDIRDDIIAIKELECHDRLKYSLGCLSERRLHFLELSCS